MPRDQITREATIGQLLDEIVDRIPEQDAVVFADRDYRQTWSEFRDTVDRAARGLMALPPDAQWGRLRWDITDLQDVFTRRKHQLQVAGVDIEDYCISHECVSWLALFIVNLVSLLPMSNGQPHTRAWTPVTHCSAGRSGSFKSIAV